MERKSLGWIWAAIGITAVGILIVSGVGRRPRLSMTPNPTQPVIVEPIQPGAEVVAPIVPPMTARPPVGATAEAVPAPTLATETSTKTATAPAAATLVHTATTTTALPGDGPDRVRTIQQALRTAGYEPGPADGKMGRMTQKAIRQFQEAQGLSVDGKVGPKTWAKLEPYLRQTDTTATAQ